ncbi:MAG: amidohydrolase family protein [Burkholderiales bacterium]
MHTLDDERGRYLIDELLADTGSGHRVIATVFVQSEANMYRTHGPDRMKPVGEVEFANGIAAMSASGRYGPTQFCAAIVGHADLSLREDVRPVLEAMITAGNGRFRGIRDSLTWDSSNTAKRQSVRYRALDPTFRRGFACLQALGLSFDAWMFYQQLADLVDLLRAFPDSNVILDHSGGLMGSPSPEAAFPAWRDRMRELAPFPNLSVKVGGLGMPRRGWDFHAREVPPTSEELAAAWRPYVETCIETFTPARCMLESNFPVDKQSCGYGVFWNAMKRITRGCSDAEKRALYGRTASRVYRLASV